jgi:hypothetical protein
MVSAAEEGVAPAIRRLAVRTPVVVLVYDPESYPMDKLVVDYLSAADPDFIAALSGPNVSVRMVPYPYGSTS